MVRRDDEVCRQGQLEAATEGQAVDRGDDRLGAVEELGETPEAAGAVIGIHGLAGRGCLEIPAG